MSFVKQKLAWQYVRSLHEQVKTQKAVDIVKVMLILHIAAILKIQISMRVTVKMSIARLGI